MNRRRHAAGRAPLLHQGRVRGHGAARLGRWSGLALAVLLLLLGSGCARIFGTSLAGQWSGTYSATSGGGGILLLNLEVAGVDVSGTWESSFPGAVVSGTVEGIVDDLVALKLTPTALPDCPYNVVAEQDGARLEGTYASACVLTGSGSFSLTKR